MNAIAIPSWSSPRIAPRATARGSTFAVVAGSRLSCLPLGAEPQPRFIGEELAKPSRKGGNSK